MKMVIRVLCQVVQGRGQLLMGSAARSTVIFLDFRRGARRQGKNEGNQTAALGSFIPPLGSAEVRALNHCLYA